MNQLLDNKIILLTGGNGLLGSEIRKKLISHNAICINIDINQKTKDDYSDYCCDITNPDEVKCCIEAIIKKYKKIDGLINNAYPRSADWNLKFEERIDSYSEDSIIVLKTLLRARLSKYLLAFIG